MAWPMKKVWVEINGHDFPGRLRETYDNHCEVYVFFNGIYNLRNVSYHAITDRMDSIGDEIFQARVQLSKNTPRLVELDG